MRPIGSESSFPFHYSQKYEGCSPRIRGLLSRRIRGKEDILKEADSLVDLLESLDALNENRPPGIGKTHPFVGWLVQPISKWPEFTIDSVMEGDQYVSERLLMKSSGFHDNLSSSPTLE